MNPEEISKEIEKCSKSPYYLATTYFKVNGKPFTTPLSEEEFNQMYYELKKLKRYPSFRSNRLRSLFVFGKVPK